MNKPEANIAKATLSLPPGLVDSNKASPIVFVDTKGVDLSSPIVIKQINKILFDVLCQIHHSEIYGQTLIKVHIGEPKCVTRMRPEYITGSVHFLKHRGASSVVGGDTTVAYSGPRGHKQNPPGNAIPYMKLAQRHGWSTGGSAGVPFVVLDRPCTAIPSEFEFKEEQKQIEIGNIRRFKDFFPAGGLLAADFVINHAHLTLHGLAGIAGCVKSIAMGCSGLIGKLRMHQYLLPSFDREACEGCALCVESCPEGALTLTEENTVPKVASELCIGCGECVAVCCNQAVTMYGKDISDWQRGEDTLPLRMADYVLGLMNGWWEKTIHVLHMYDITRLCDCVSQRQKPLLEDIGFLISKNPFAIDEAAVRMVREALGKAECEIGQLNLKASDDSTNYLREVYGIITEVPVHKISLSEASYQGVSFDNL